MSVTLLFMIRNGRQLAEAEEQKYGRKPKFVNPKVKTITKPNKTIKLTMSIPKFNNYDYSILDSFTWNYLQRTKVRKIIKPDGSHHFIVVPATKKSTMPILKINSAGDVLVHQQGTVKKYSHTKLPLFYEDVAGSVMKLNKTLFPLTQGEKEAIKNGKLLNRIVKFFSKLFKK